MDYISRYQSPLGGITLSSDGRFLTGLWFDGQKYFGSTLGADYAERDLPVFRQAAEWLDRYFEGRQPHLRPPLRLRGTEFQREVWNLLLAIPRGQTATYAAIARRVADGHGLPRMSAQAVGGAVGRNPLSLIVPCHRVVGSDGSLTGYAGGLDRKRALLELEGVDMAALSGMKMREK
ncbi:6-O-methylguanine DNA methyltransferase [Prevotella sp. oral taxon 376]|uniref:methylated-DNA--[protein]-cysteine S-methyltransferase n=1 Tax=Prevotella sp. oral taxon 376 TaxID=712466 RepID=UPI000D1E2C40|nr:methylated-DNA--[protein]-cysteine S-methyltransferase [Prevotella sp. oral taxon 376]PTL34254.1 6-O-methylguanine DNA methyltransferase [Prevotella sp. oral taxon 376]